MGSNSTSSGLFLTFDVTVGSRCFAFVVVYVTMHVMFGPPTRLQQVSSPLVTLLFPDLCSHDDPRVVSKISNLAVLALNHKGFAPFSAYLHGGPMTGIVG